MSADESVGRYEIDVGEGEPLDSDSTVLHVDYGPLAVDDIRVFADRTEVDFTDEVSPRDATLTLTATGLRDAWGDTIWRL